jgi:TRAP transporter TAXI family solute receptor
VLRCVRVVSLVLAGLLASGPVAAADNGAGGVRAGNTFGLAAGPAAASETVLAADMASLFPQGDLSILPVLGDAGTANLARLATSNVDLAFVATHVLAEAVAEDATLRDRLELVTRLAPQEVHVLARADIGRVSELSGRQVNFGPAGSASAVTAAALFKALGVEVEVSSFDTNAAIERLKQGAISAVVVVGGKPAPVIAAIPLDSGIHLLPVSFGVPLEAEYLPTRLGSADYPNLIRHGDEVVTVATGLVLLAASSKDDPGSAERLARFVETVFPRFAELQAQGHHPKWREVNLAASLPGFKRNSAAASWLLAQQDAQKRPLTANADAGQAPALPQSLSMTEAQKEVLFKRFIEWQRGNGR